MLHNDITKMEQIRAKVFSINIFNPVTANLRVYDLTTKELKTVLVHGRRIINHILKNAPTGTELLIEATKDNDRLKLVQCLLLSNNKND